MHMICKFHKIESLKEGDKMKFNLDLEAKKFGENYNYILESENPIALSYENYEDLCTVIENKTVTNSL